MKSNGNLLRMNVLNEQVIFKSRTEDFFKIFAVSIIAFLLSFHSGFLTSPLVILTTVYLLDGGHVYSTLLEVYADPVELKKGYVWIVTISSFLLTLAVLALLPDYFFYYIFYFTVFHNMRQGLGVTFLYKQGEKTGQLFYKYSYYFLTVMPFILFHFRKREMSGQLSESIIRSIDFFQFFPEKNITTMYHYGLVFYALGLFFILLAVYRTKNFRGFLSMTFFSFVYVFAFIFSRNEFQSYILLIFSHAIPYFFLMEKRIAKTHSLAAVKKYSLYFVILIFVLGAGFDYRRAAIIDYFFEVDILIRALVVTPLIAHFIFDAILWKRGNERFKAFLAP